MNLVNIIVSQLLLILISIFFDIDIFFFFTTWNINLWQGKDITN